jgi:hypothetical protein
MNSILQEVVWQEVDSSNITAVAYHEDSGQILVRFKDGGEYAYEGCDLPLYERFKNAPSVGKFFYANIKPKSFERLN